MLTRGNASPVERRAVMKVARRRRRMHRSVSVPRTIPERTDDAVVLSSGVTGFFDAVRSTRPHSASVRRRRAVRSFEHARHSF